MSLFICAQVLANRARHQAAADLVLIKNSMFYIDLNCNGRVLTVMLRQLTLQYDCKPSAVILEW